MDSSTLFTSISASLIFGAAVGAVVSNLRKGNKDQQSEVIQLQQNEIAAYKDSNTRLSESNAALVAENTTLKQANKDLKGIAQQTPEIKKLIKVVGELVNQMGRSYDQK